MQIAKVRLRKPRRVISFLCGDIGLQRDDACIVQTDRGVEWGTCILPPEPCSSEVEKRCTMRVMRKVSTNDIKTFDTLQHDERQAYTVCLEKIRQRALPMKLVDAEYTFDKKRVIFYFTAEDRVDFRELVRDLAHELRTRIELRHIQVRDEAKMVGGLGCCGIKLCCATWLDEFKPISMRMAKRQNLSLNPAKISGQCGRLLCCLEYENDMYEDPRKRCKHAPAPPPPKEIEEPEDEEEPLPLPTAEDEELAEDGEDAWDAEESEDEASDASDQEDGSPDSAGKRSRRRGRRRRKHSRPESDSNNSGRQSS